jgi:hypothetical protein
MEFERLLQCGIMAVERFVSVRAGPRLHGLPDAAAGLDEQSPVIVTIFQRTLADVENSGCVGTTMSTLTPQAAPANTMAFGGRCPVCASAT